MRDLDKAIQLFSDILGTKFGPPLVEDKAFFLKSAIDPMGLNLISSLKPDGVMARSIEKRGEGVQAISFKVPNLDEAVKELEAKGLKLVGRIDGKRIKEAQFHPKDTFGVMIELTQYEEEHPISVVARGK